MIAKPKDFGMAVLLLILTAVLYARSTVIHVGVVHALGPMFFPRLLLYCIGALSLVMLVGSLRRRPGAAAAVAKEKTPQEPGAFALQWGFVGLLLAYLVLLPLTGYLWTTMGFLFLGMALLGPRRPRNFLVYAVVSAAVTLGLQLVFSTLLHLFLP